MTTSLLRFRVAYLALVVAGCSVNAAGSGTGAALPNDATLPSVEDARAEGTTDDADLDAIFPTDPSDEDAAPTVQDEAGIDASIHDAPTEVADSGPFDTGVADTGIVADTANDGITTPPPPPPPPPPTCKTLGATSIEGHCYLDTWPVYGNEPGLEGYCARLGGHLASIHSATVEANLVTLLRGGAAFIGLMRVPQTTNLYWTDGSSVDYKAWAPGEPAYPNGHCTRLGANGWSVHTCAPPIIALSPGICEVR